MGGRMIRSDKLDQVCASMFAVRRDAGQPKKDSKAKIATKSGGSYSYEYLSLPALIEHLQPHLEKWSLFVTQEVRGRAGYVEVYTTVWHANSAQFIEFGPAALPAKSEDPQDHKGAITSCRRYALASVFNIAADEDDDISAVPPKAGGKPDAGMPATDAATLPVTDALSLGEGVTGAGGDAVATEEQTERLLAVVGGSEPKAISRLNRVNLSSYTKSTWRFAKMNEVAKAITGGEV